jgi:hypothetical protein
MRLSGRWLDAVFDWLVGDVVPPLGQPRRLGVVERTIWVVRRVRRIGSWVPLALVLLLLEFVAGPRRDVLAPLWAMSAGNFPFRAHRTWRRRILGAALATGAVVPFASVTQWPVFSLTTGLVAMMGASSISLGLVGGLALTLAVSFASEAANGVSLVTPFALGLALTTMRAYYLREGRARPRLHRRRLPAINPRQLLVKLVLIVGWRGFGSRTGTWMGRSCCGSCWSSRLASG